MDIYENKQDFAYSALKRLVLTCELKPNEKISRQDLAEQLRVGNTPIREAILRLEREGLFRTVPQSGTFVTAINIAEVSEAGFIRKNIEKLIFKEAFEKATKQDIKELEKTLVIQRMIFDSNDFEMLFRFDDQFHEYFYRIAEKHFTWSWIEMINIIPKRVSYLQSMNEESSWHEIHTDHENIVKTLKNNDKEKYIELVTRHIEDLQPATDLMYKSYPDYFETKN